MQPLAISQRRHSYLCAVGSPEGMERNVRFGSETATALSNRDVRFIPESCRDMPSRDLG
jgi:hypothetical protein